VPVRRSPFQYAIVRVVPDLARGEGINVGVILFAPTKRFLGARLGLDERRLAALSRDLSPADVRAHLEGIERITLGRPDGGPIASTTLTERFHWLVAPSSTIIQTSEVHTGLCTDPEAELDRLYRTLVGTDGQP
jgi:Protein of unknown function (DUF3037)